MATNSFVKFCQDRRAVRERLAAVRRGRRRLRDGRGLGRVPAQAPGRRRARRRQDLRGRPRDRRLLATARARASRPRTRSASSSRPQRAWEDAGLDPATATLVEAHGTSTKVGDVVEVESLASIFKGAARGQIALGSAKSNIGHLKAAAGAAGLLKAVWAVHEKCLPPTLNAQPSNPDIDFAATPFRLNHELRRVEALERRSAPLRRLRLRLRGHELPRRARRARTRRAHEGLAPGTGVGPGVLRLGCRRRFGHGIAGPPAGARPGRDRRGVARRPAPEGRDAARAGEDGRRAAGRGAGSSRPGGTGADRDRLRGRRRAGRAPAEGAEGPGQGRAAHLAGLPGAGRLPRQRQGRRQDRVPVHGPGQPVRQHGPRPRGHRARGGRGVRGGRPRPRARSSGAS